MPMTSGEHESEAMQPPAYLEEKLDDLLLPSNPRLVVVTHRRWMEPYHALEEGELSARLTATRAHPQGFTLWLRQIALFQSAFNRGYDWSQEPNREVRKAVAFRLELLGLACGNAKLALDAALAGFYSGAMAIERHMLETWRRVAYARLSPEDVWRWYPQTLWPDDILPAPDGGMPTSQPTAKEIARKIDERGSDWDKAYLPKVRSGFEILTDHAHPTLEGATQTWDAIDPDRRVFGPTFSDPHCRRCLTWGLTTGAMLAEEIALIDPQNEEWFAELASIAEQLGPWLAAHQH